MNRMIYLTAFIVSLSIGSIAQSQILESPLPPPEGVQQQPAHESHEALAEVNATRAKKGLKPFQMDAGLTKAAMDAAAYRAKRLMAGHTSNDFAFVPQGSKATAAGCAAWEDSWGWGSCCTYERWTFAGAAWARGRDGRRYMHLYVR